MQKYIYYNKLKKAKYLLSDERDELEVESRHGYSLLCIFISEETGGISDLITEINRANNKKISPKEFYENLFRFTGDNPLPTPA